MGGLHARRSSRPDLRDDPRFATAESRRANARALTLILDAVFLDRDWSEWRERLLKSGIAFGVVGTLEDIPDDPQMYASGTLVPMEDSRAGAASP